MKAMTALLIVLVVVDVPGITQDSTAINRKHRFTFSGYADIYYQYDFNKPSDKLRPPFLYNFRKHNELNSNLVLFKGNYKGEKISANLGIMTGNYAKYNLAAEPAFFRYINEASITYKFSDRFSADAGIIPSHIGSESAIAKDNWNLSRSLLAENSPYYETGIKLNYTPNDQWTFSMAGLQGWQNIKDHNSAKAIGTQVVFTPDEKWIFNSSTYLGNEKADTAKQLRLFHNFYVIYAMTDKIQAAIVLDMGAERKIDKSGFNKWMGTALLFRYSFARNFAAAARGEFYRDKNGVIISGYGPGPFEITGLAFNIDHGPTKNFIIRAEMRSLHSKHTIFIRNNLAVQSNFSLLCSVAFYF